MSVCLSVGQSVRGRFDDLFVCLSVCLLVCWSICRSGCRSVSLQVDRSSGMSIYWFVCVSDAHSTCLYEVWSRFLQAMGCTKRQVRSRSDVMLQDDEIEQDSDDWERKEQYGGGV